MELTGEGEIRHSEPIRLDKNFLLFDPNRATSVWYPPSGEVVTGGYISSIELDTGEMPPISFRTITDDTLSTRLQTIVPVREFTGEGYSIDNRDFSLPGREEKVKQFRVEHGDEEVDRQKVPFTIWIDQSDEDRKKMVENGFMETETVQAMAADGTPINTTYTRMKIKDEYLSILNRLHLYVATSGLRFLGKLQYKGDRLFYQEIYSD